MLSSCSVNEVREASEFKQSWELAGKNSAVSWRYVGEIDYSYFVTERLPFRRSIGIN